MVVSFNLLPLEQHNAMCLIITDLTEHKQNQQLQDSDRRKDEFLAIARSRASQSAGANRQRGPLLNLSNQGNDETVKWACEIVDRQVKQLTRMLTICSMSADHPRENQSAQSAARSHGDSKCGGRDKPAADRIAAAPFAH